MKGFVIFDGFSPIDNAPIVAIATMQTSNIKTGNMIQTWIIRSDIDPLSASKNKLDASICGTCPHRHSLGGGCYVQLFQAPLKVYKSFKAGKYPIYDSKKHSNYFFGRKLRIGSYGDPSVVPFDTWDHFIKLSNGHTGYTHHYGAKHFDDRLLSILQISVDTEKRAKQLHKKGLKTFRVVNNYNDKFNNEVICIADNNKNATCYDCMLCNGNNKNIVIQSHGARKKRVNNVIMQTKNI